MFPVEMDTAWEQMKLYVKGPKAKMQLTVLQLVAFNFW